MTAKTIKFVGAHPNLDTGSEYSIKEYSKVVGVTEETMRWRLKNTMEVNDFHLKFGEDGKPDSTIRNKSRALLARKLV